MRFLRLLPLLVLFALPLANAQSDLILTGVIDGPLTGGTPKAVEVYVVNDVPDLSIYGIGSANNGQGSDGEEFTFPAVSATAGDFLYVASESDQFTNWFGFAPDYTDGAANVNGDDALELFMNGAVVDVFGDVNTAGTGQPWEYMDGWAYRVDGTGPDESTFSVDNFTYSGPNALDGETSNASASIPFPTGTYSPDGDVPPVVSFASTSASVAEDGGSVTLSVTISVAPTTDTTVDVVLDTGNSTASTSDVGGFASETVTFTPSGPTTQTVTVTVTDDSDVEPAETAQFVLQNLSGDPDASLGSNTTFTLTINDDDTPIPTNVVINEIDPDTPGTDTAEFIELRTTDPTTALDGLVLVLINGSSDTSYGAFDLDGYTTDANGVFVLCEDATVVSGCDGDALSSIQNGPDAVALYVGDGTDFPNGTAASSTNLVDAIVYGSSRDEELLTALGETVQFEDTDTTSLQRLAISDGVDVEPSALFYSVDASPDAVNPAALTVDQTDSVDDAAGYRLASVPVLDAVGSPKDVDDVAAINLVQGVPGGTNPAQYPEADVNLFTTYTGGGDGAFTGPASTDEDLVPGAGFFWYWFDQALDPADDAAGGGTSVGYDLADEAFAFSLTGVPLDDSVTDGSYSWTMDANADGFYMVGNPYAYPFRLGGMSVSDGTLQSGFAVWNPTLGTYEDLTANASDPFAGDALPVWNGAFAEVIGTTGASVDFLTTSAFVDPTASAAGSNFVGRLAMDAEPQLRLRLQGELSGGANVTDHAAVVRFLDDADVAWDVHDGSKLLPPLAAYALLAPVGERDGARRHQRTRSLPLAFDDALTIPVAFQTTEAGSFTVSFENVESLPEAWAVRFVDRVTGESFDVRSGASHPFQAEATDWTDRFELVISSATAVADEEGPEAPVALSRLRPNPAAQTTTLDLRVTEPQPVAVTVIDMLGRTVARVFDGDVAAGAEVEIAVDAARLAPGAYLVRVAGETFVETRQLVVAR